MSSNERLLKLKEHLRKRRPDFIRELSHLRKEVPADAWRRPKGVHSKMRHQMNGKRALVEVGYRSPAALRGMSRAGLRLVRVSTLKELASLKQGDAALLTNTGMRVRHVLLKEAILKKIPIANIKDPAKAVAAIEQDLAQRRAAKKAAAAKTAAAPAKAEPAKQAPAAAPAKAEHKPADHKPAAPASHTEKR
jgi:large subunit ribosomal protein L32e